MNKDLKKIDTFDDEIILQTLQCPLGTIEYTTDPMVYDQIMETLGDKLKDYGHLKVQQALDDIQ